MSSTSAINSLISSSSNASSGVNISSLLAAATGATSTGIDVAGAVAAAVYAAQAPERQWQAQQASLKAQTDALSSIQSAATALSNDLNSLNDINGPIAARSVSSTYSNVVTATAAAGTPTGTHVVVVSNLASTASWYSPSAPSPSATLGSGDVHITTSGGGDVSIALGGGVNTLSDLVNAINAKNLGITASIVNDATGARLAVTGNSTGAASDFSISSGAVTTSSWSSSSVASSSTALSASTFNLSDGSSSVTLTVSAGETLDQLASNVNAQGLSLQASVVTDGSGAHLAIASTGASPALTISSDPACTFTRASTASNASLTVDGVPITSASNTVTGAVGGLTINLLNASFGAEVNLSVATDTVQVSAAVTQFVKDYNSALGLVNAQFAYNPGTQTQGVLGGDASVRSLQNTLMRATAYTNGSGSSISTLASLGINMGDDGSLSLNSAQLTSALGKNADAVQSFLQGAALNGFANSFQQQLVNFTSPSSGALSIDLKSLNQENTDLQNHINEFESGYIASQRTVLTNMYSKAEIALQQLPTTLKQISAELGTSSGK